ncbi:uncharacterized protein J4E84_005099 [Alternaria hordeiaustralica]|uniref:uncharacterized protein n=1 Tax=Alternaria hordeiaustralica TaxID=1187925 RepID=UPI0020C4A43E|nr:uncharacterized protein J4E84_005099 [Alternaria hordeiaustralica]KAI4688170.1 hypothetical protein J4E84_005099 [Alternaria hordeiaustralica]
MAIKVHEYKLPPTALIPNSPYPLLHYPGLLYDMVTSPNFKTREILDLYASNGWQTQWIAQYGMDIQSHYHSTTHEAMTVISGEGAWIRFGVADSPSWSQGKYEPGDRGDGEVGGVDIKAELGDVFIIPAGVSHKTFLPRPRNEELAFHQPKDVEEGRAAEVDEEKEAERRRFFESVDVSGGKFMMMGAYPYGGVWDFAVGGEHDGKEGEVWKVGMPEKDPVLGDSDEGLRGLWEGVEEAGGRVVMGLRELGFGV